MHYGIWWVSPNALRWWQILSSSATFNLSSKKDPLDCTVGAKQKQKDYFKGHCNKVSVRSEQKWQNKQKEDRVHASSSLLPHHPCLNHVSLPPTTSLDPDSPEFLTASHYIQKDSYLKPPQPKPRLLEHYFLPTTFKTLLDSDSNARRHPAPCQLHLSPHHRSTAHLTLLLPLHLQSFPLSAPAKPPRLNKQFPQISPEESVPPSGLALTTFCMLLTFCLNASPGTCFCHP